MSLATFTRSTRLFYTQALAVELTYRFSLIQGFIGVAVSWLGLVLFWMAAGKAGNGAYTQGALLLYFLYASGHTIIQESRVSWNLSAGIRMGKLAASLLRPYPFLVSVVCQAAAFATVRFVILFVAFAIVVLLSSDLQAAASALTSHTAAQYLLALGLSLALGWVTRIGIGLLAFDMTQTWGPELIFLSLYVAASGVAFPPDLLPAAIHTVITWTPVYYMVGFPSLVLLGRVDGAAFEAELVRGAVVFVLMAAVVWVEWRRGMRKFEAVGL